MFKKIYIINLLLLTTFLLISFNNVHCEIVEINLTDDIPKNIMVGTFFNDKNHIKPMLDICTILVERGYNVILVSPDKFTLSSEYPNVKHVSLKLQIDAKDSIKDMPLQKYAGAFNTYEKISKKYNIDLFLCDVMANDACLDVAHRLNKPLVGYGSFLLEFALKPKYDLNKKLKDSLFLANTFYGFELPKSLPPNVLEIGPVLSENHPPLTRKLSSFLNSHNRILYVNLDMHGFTTENNSILLQSFIEAINENIIDGVIWLLPKTSFNKFFSTLKLSDGTLIHTSSILNSKNSNIYIMEFVPQFSILNHNNTKLFLNNGCAVSCYESLYAATPMLLIPRDNQMGYAEKLNTVGTGIILNQLQLNVKNILEKVDLMLKDEQIKRNVKKLENLTKINSKRKYKAADLIEYILHTNGENINEKSLKELKELITSDVQIGFNRKQLYDTYGNFILGIGFMIISGIFYVVIRVIRLLVRIKIISVGLNVKKD